jgi:hypothetical protein
LAILCGYNNFVRIKPQISFQPKSLYLFHYRVNKYFDQIKAYIKEEDNPETRLLMFIYKSFQRVRQLICFFPQPASCQISRLSRIQFPLDEASSIDLPDTPKISLAIEASLMLASSNTF